MLAVLLCGSCEPSDDAFLQTQYVRYTTDQPFAPCGGLADDTDRKIEHLFDRIGEPLPPRDSIAYKWVSDNSSLVCIDYAAGCTRLEADGVKIAALELAQFHELAHAVHFLTLGLGHRVLSEGFATYYADQPGELSAEAMALFGASIESMIVEGVVPGDQYPFAAHFVGVTIERYGLEAFKRFWQDVDRSASSDEFRAAYERRYREPWSDALATIAARKRSVYTDIACRGEARSVGVDGLNLVFEQTCMDEGVLGPVLRDGAIAGEVLVPLELSEGMYRFSFVTPGTTSDPAAAFRGCHEGAPALVAPVGLFFPGDAAVYLAAGRYLLSVRVPLVADAVPLELTIVREG